MIIWTDIIVLSYFFKVLHAEATDTIFYYLQHFFTRLILYLSLNANFDELIFCWLWIIYDYSNPHFYAWPAAGSLLLLCILFNFSVIWWLMSILKGTLFLVKYLMICKVFAKAWWLRSANIVVLGILQRCLQYSLRWNGDV